MHWMSERSRESIKGPLLVTKGLHSLVLWWGTLQHGLGDTAQYVDFFLGQLRAVKQLVQARHELLGCSRVQKANVRQRLLPVAQHAGHLLRVSTLRTGVCSTTGKPPSAWRHS